MDNQRTLLFGREQWCLASNVGQFRQAFKFSTYSIHQSIGLYSKFSAKTKHVKDA